MLSYQVAVHQRYWAATRFQEFGAQHIGDRGFSGARQSGKEDGYTLLVPRRITAPQFMDYFRIGEPSWNIAALI